MCSQVTPNSVGSNEFSAPESIWLSEEHAGGWSLLSSSLGLLVSFNVLLKKKKKKAYVLKILSYRLYEKLKYRRGCRVSACPKGRAALWDSAGLYTVVPWGNKGAGAWLGFNHYFCFVSLHPLTKGWARKERPGSAEMYVELKDLRTGASCIVHGPARSHCIQMRVCSGTIIYVPLCRASLVCEDGLLLSFRCFFF